MIAENAVLLTLCWRRGTARLGWVMADLVATIAVLVVGAVLTAPSLYGTWANYAYPYSLIAQILVGLGVRRLSVLLTATGAMFISYVMVNVFIHGEPAWNSCANGVAYFANGLVAWLVAREVRRGGRRLDDNTRVALEQAELLARSQERAGAAAALHDRVLQTLEMLAQGPWITDERLRRHVAVEAGWLRRFVEDTPDDRPTDLLEELRDVIDRHQRLGVRISLNDTQFRQHAVDLPPARLAALSGAFNEALTNVAKHAGSGAATIHLACEDDGVAVTVVDQGRGFDPARPVSGRGLHHSIRERITEAGGTADIDSAPGQGTFVRLWMPSA